MQFKNRIRDSDYEPGDLVLVRNTPIKKELNQKTKPCYLGPMVVLRRTTGGLYLLAKLDGAISKLRYAAFCLLSYFLQTKISVPVTELTGLGEEELDKYNAEEDITHEEENEDAVAND